MTASATASTPQSAAVRGWLPALAISFLISLLIVLPFFWMGNASGHDFQFHAQSWLDVAGQWKQGVFYPRWAEWADHGYGEPRFIFYPPNSWILGAALGSLLRWHAVPPVFIVLVQTFAGLSAFFLARRVLPAMTGELALTDAPPKISRGVLLCVACYAANPYALLNVYLRADFAELLADALYPLLFLAALELCGLLQRRADAPLADQFPYVARFAIVYALIWLSNAPAGVIASYSSALLFAFAAITHRSWRPLARAVSGLTLGLALAGFYLLPAIYEQRWVNISQALSTGLLPAENFLFTEINDPEHTLFNFTASSLAVLLITLTGFAAIRTRRRNDHQQNDASVGATLWAALLMLTTTATFLMLRISSPLWALLPKLRFVQFPWRWMSLLAIPFALFLAPAMARKRWGWAWALITFACIGTTGVVLVDRGWWDTQDIPALREAISNGSGYDGTDEYDPAGDDHTNIPTKSLQVRVMDTDTMQGPVIKPTLRVELWSPEQKIVSVSSRLPFFLGLRLINYPAWRVDVNGNEVATRGGEDYNEMIVPMPSGNSTVRVTFCRTWDRIAGGIVSLAGLLFAGWLLYPRHNSRSSIGL